MKTRSNLDISSIQDRWRHLRSSAVGGAFSTTAVRLNMLGKTSFTQQGFMWHHLICQKPVMYLHTDNDVINLNTNRATAVICFTVVMKLHRFVQKIIWHQLVKMSLYYVLYLHTIFYAIKLAVWTAKLNYVSASHTLQVCEQFLYIHLYLLRKRWGESANHPATQ